MCTALDDSNQVWVFGGSTLNHKIKISNMRNDLWKWDGRTWQWVAGADTADNLWEYHYQRNPSARKSAACYLDSLGNFYVFGGLSIIGKDSSKYKIAVTSDFWKYARKDNGWAMLGGDTTGKDSTVFVEKGKTSPINKPGPRYSTVYWKRQGSFFLYGGRGLDQSGQIESGLDEYWQWSENQWTYKMGSEDGNFSFYPQLGAGDSASWPGARFYTASVTTTDGSLYLYGGSLPPIQYDYYTKNDLWKYQEGIWTWLSGSEDYYSEARYCIKAYPNLCDPGARGQTMLWGGKNSELFLFGGYFHFMPWRITNDLWVWDGNNWHWKRKNTSYNGRGIYGELGKPGVNSWPGARMGSATWTDSLGNLWLFGGYGYDADSNLGYLNDLWKYTPDYTVATETPHAQEMALYPNPSHGRLTIGLPHAGDIQWIEVMDLQGNTLLRQESQLGTLGTAAVDLGRLPVGLYLLHVQTKTGRYHGRFAVGE
jgi:hypothetical protein